MKFIILLCDTSGFRYLLIVVSEQEIPYMQKESYIGLTLGHVYDTKVVFENFPCLGKV